MITNSYHNLQVIKASSEQAQKQAQKQAQSYKPHYRSFGNFFKSNYKKNSSHQRKKHLPELTITRIAFWTQ